MTEGTKLFILMDYFFTDKTHLQIAKDHSLSVTEVFEVTDNYGLINNNQVCLKEDIVATINKMEK